MILLLLRLILALLGVLAGAGALLLWLALALLFWLATTTSGLRVLLDALASTGMVQVGQVEGSLSGRMKLKDVRVDVGGARVYVHCAELDWQPLELMQRRVQVDRLWLSGVQTELAEASTKEEEASAPWKGLSLPVEVFVDDLQVDEVSLLPPLQKGGGGDLRRAEISVPMAAPSPQPSPARGEGAKTGGEGSERTRSRMANRPVSPLIGREPWRTSFMPL